MKRLLIAITLLLAVACAHAGGAQIQYHDGYKYQLAASYWTHIHIQAGSGGSGYTQA